MRQSLVLLLAILLPTVLVAQKNPTAQSPPLGCGQV